MMGGDMPSRSHRVRLQGRRFAPVVALLAAASLLQGCASYYYGERYGPTVASVVRGSVMDASYRAADALLERAVLDPVQPVMVATLVSVDQLNESSRLGRLVSEQLAGRMVQRGVRVTEIKLRETLALRQDQGALLLSRELREVSRSHQAQAVVVGTYAVSARQVFVSLKLVQPEGNVVVAAHDYAMALDDDVRTLLYAR